MATPCYSGACICAECQPPSGSIVDQRPLDRGWSGRQIRCQWTEACTPGALTNNVPNSPMGARHLTESTAIDLLERPAYSAAEAGRLVGVAPGRVRRWLSGYEYTDGVSVRGLPPVLRGRAEMGSYSSFLDLVDLLFVKRFLDHGVSLQKVRRALDEARAILGTPHFARRTFFTDGATIFLRLQEEADKDGDKGAAILDLMSGGQWVIAPLIEQLAQQVDFDSAEGLASRWYPLGPEKPVVLDPKVSFGAPTIAGRGVKTLNVHDLFVAEGESLASVRTWWELTDAEIMAAVDFERQLAAIGSSSSRLASL